MWWIFKSIGKWLHIVGWAVHCIWKCCSSCIFWVWWFLEMSGTACLMTHCCIPEDSSLSNSGVRTWNHIIQINQPTRCNNFSSLLLDVYLHLNIFWVSSCPSSGAQQWPVPHLCYMPSLSCSALHDHQIITCWELQSRKVLGIQRISILVVWNQNKYIFFASDIYLSFSVTASTNFLPVYVHYTFCCFYSTNYIHV
jgi:hypothetical protein